VIGIATEHTGASHILFHSIHDWWVQIDSEVLLLVFLPGLLYKDASGLHVHFFKLATSQCLIFAFPMVLAGTYLTAAVCYYIFPYDWSMNLCLTAGSILSATDPVAVAALLEQVGAPPRLKVHIAGEALLNDGSAIVFYTIFSLQYLTELNVEGLGTQFDIGSGIGRFFRMSLGAVAIGLLFGLGTLFVMSKLNRRLNHEENVVQVTGEISVAYLCYFVADVVWGTSGVIATVIMGLLINEYGKAATNDKNLRNSFFSIVEHILNTVLFSLGGLVWGVVIANANDEVAFVARDWGYLFLLYIFLTVIRFGLFAITYPVTSRIGLKTSIAETVFQAYGGLRGAVGIALAIALDNAVGSANASDPVFSQQTRKVFGFVGGIAFLTLFINATTAGPVLKKLGLADTTVIRERILQSFRRNWRHAVLEDVARLLHEHVCYPRINFAVVTHHVPLLKDLTSKELLEAVQIYREEEAEEGIKTPDLTKIVAQLETDNPSQSKLPITDTIDEHSEFETSMAFEPSKSLPVIHLHRERQRSHQRQASRNRQHSRRQMTSLGLIQENMSLLELRLVFLELVRSTYERQIERGELSDDREDVALALTESLDLCADKVQNGEPLQDWKLANDILSFTRKTIGLLSPLERLVKLYDLCLSKYEHAEFEFHLERIRIESALSFSHAHKTAQEYFRQEFVTDDFFSASGSVVLEESRKQVEEAEKLVTEKDQDVVETVVSHKFCTVLLLNAARYVEEAGKSGLLKPVEAEEALEEVQHSLYEVNSCSLKHHQDEEAKEEYKLTTFFSLSKPKKKGSKHS